MLQLVWYRNDLRTYDHPALFQAMKAGPTVAVYALCAKQWEAHHDAPAKQTLILSQLIDLERELKGLNVPLVVLDLKSFEELPGGLIKWASEQGCAHLYYNHDYGLNEQRVARRVEVGLSKEGISTSSYHDQCIVQPGQIRTGSGSYYAVFSAFRRAFLKQYRSLARHLYLRPESQPKPKIKSDLSVLEKYPVEEKWLDIWPISEDIAHDKLNEFIEERSKKYKADRDFPGINGTSTLSPYLTVGVLSTSQCLRAALSVNRGELDGGYEGVSTWINELLWREFYRHLLYAHPKLSQFKAYKEETDRLKWREDDALFEAWKDGKTGFPIVDAAMRQLKEQGWMHNRLRMVVAMFLTKDLFIDWRKGEQYFMEQLVDGDLASNNGGWQWAASTGVDAAPYFRVFNPVRQSERFDPDGDFIRRFVPELKDLDKRSIHMPTQEQCEALDYPRPIVDHRTAVAQVKDAFKTLSN